VLDNGETASLANVADLSYRRGFDSLKHTGGLLAITIAADVDGQVNNANLIRADLADTVIPEVMADYGVQYTFRGDAENQAESVGDVLLAVPLALIMIYIILAWVFGSYAWPFAVLSVIPFGIVGAFFGHWLINVDITLFSVFGLFGLSGIVINDSIILVTVFKELRDAGMGAVEAAIEAGVRRFRAVFLTSLTTVVGIMPLLLERAQQAQFLKPMVTSVSFGLIFGTFMVIFLLPSLLVAMEAWRDHWSAVKSRFPQWMVSLDVASLLSAAEPKARMDTDPSIFAKPGAKR
jgi:multidrug efflux pump subunit AcrB